MTLGRPRLHLRTTASTNQRARELASAGAPSGTLVTASEQTAGRGREGRTWTAPAGRALLLSLIVRELDSLISLRAGLAVADLAGGTALVKWPNDVLVDGRKVAGILVEARPQEGWAVIGIGVNAAFDVRELPRELHESAGTLGLRPRQLDAALAELIRHLERRLAEPADATLRALSERDALRDRAIGWAGGEGAGAGIDERGCLRVRRADGTETVLDAGEIHLRVSP